MQNVNQLNQPSPPQSLMAAKMVRCEPHTQEPRGPHAKSPVRPMVVTQQSANGTHRANEHIPACPVDHLCSEIVRLEQQLGKVLHASRYPEIRGLRARICGHTVMLEGHVSSYFMKQMAQETIREIVHGHWISNQVLVRKPR